MVITLGSSEIGGNCFQPPLVSFLGTNLCVSPTLPNTGSLAASAHLSMNSTKSLKLGNLPPSLIRRALSRHYNWWSANFCNPGPSLLDMFGPSIKASTHAFVTMCGCPKHCCNILRAFYSPPGTPSKPATAPLAWPSRNCKRRDIF